AASSGRCRFRYLIQYLLTESTMSPESSTSHVSCTEARPATAKKWLAGIAVVLLGTATAATTTHAADSYPNRPITMVVPYAPGSPPDLYSRLYAERLHAYSGQSVIIENRPGANTTIGTTHVARAAPDGYTIKIGRAACRERE